VLHLCQWGDEPPASSMSPLTSDLVQHKMFIFILHLTAWGLEPVVTHQTFWLESTGVCLFCSLRNPLLMHALHAMSHEAHKLQLLGLYSSAQKADSKGMFIPHRQDQFADPAGTAVCIIMG